MEHGNTFSSLRDAIAGAGIPSSQRATWLAMMERFWDKEGAGRTSRHRGTQGLSGAGHAALQEECSRGASTHQAADEHRHYSLVGLEVCVLKAIDGLPVVGLWGG